jgi:hypothetical protein
MKFFGAILAYVIIGVILAWGIYLLVTKGNYWLLAIGTLGYILAFIKFGCLPPKKSH